MPLYVVDGNNLKAYLAGAGILHSDEDRQLVAWLRTWQAGRRQKRDKAPRLVLVFDAGAAGKRFATDSTLIVKIAPQNLTADELILREVARMPHAKGKRDAILITSDRGLAEQAKVLGVDVVDCERFAARTAAPKKASDDSEEKAEIARALGHEVDELFLPEKERIPRRPTVRRMHLSPGKVSQMRDPARLAELCHEGDRVIRRRALLALAHVRTEAGRKLAEHALLADTVPSVRAAAALALGQMGDSRSLDALRKAMGDAYTLVRAAVATALGMYGMPEVRAYLEQLQQDPSRRVRRAIQIALGDSR